MKEVVFELDRGFDCYDITLRACAEPEQVVATLLPLPRQTVELPVGLWRVSWAVQGTAEVPYEAEVSGSGVTNNPRRRRGLTLWSGRAEGLLDFEVT